MVEPWAALNDEFGRRAGFALLACLALHGRDADFLRGLALIEAAATDERNFVKKGVAWALRAIGRKESPTCAPRPAALAARLAASPTRPPAGSAGTRPAPSRRPTRWKALDPAPAAPKLRPDGAREAPMPAELTLNGSIDHPPPSRPACCRSSPSTSA